MTDEKRALLGGKEAAKRLTAGSSMNIWTGKMLLSCGGCPFWSRWERRGEDGQERGCNDFEAENHHPW